MRHLQAMRMGTVQLNEQLAWEPLGRQSLDRKLPVLDQVARGAEYRKLAVRSALNSPEVTHMGFWSINPYIGCEFGCTYCYARDTHRFTVERAVAESADAPDTRMVRRPATEAFERHILVKDRLHDIICRTLEPARIGHTAIVIGTATDPYQPAERRYGATRSVLQALLRFEGLHLGIITKSPLIMRDLDLLAEVSARHSLRVNISLASVDREMIRRLEARSPAPAARLRALSALRQRGIRAGIMMAPIVPMLTDTMRSLRILFEAGVAAGAQRIHGASLRLGPTAREMFLAQLTREFPHLVARYQKHFGRSGHASREYQLALRKRLHALQVEFGLEREGRWEEANDDELLQEPQPAEKPTEDQIALFELT
jgi:DNA repair photolyase